MFLIFKNSPKKNTSGSQNAEMAETRTANARKTLQHYPFSSQQLFLRSLSEKGTDGQSGKACDAGTIQDKMRG